MRVPVNLRWLAQFVVIFICCSSNSWAKVFERCELARELADQHKLPKQQIADWICLVKWESEFDTSVVGKLNVDGSLDHGLFQISDKFWCSGPNSTAEACGLTCEQLRDGDIKNDVICAKRIFREFQRKTGNGFNAWAGWKSRCQGDKAEFIQGCFTGQEATQGNKPAQESEDFLEESDVIDDKTIMKLMEADQGKQVESRQFNYIQKRQSQLAGQATIQQSQQIVNPPSRMSQLKSSLLTYFGNLRIVPVG